MPLDHAWIAAHIPHRGGMCLLDRVVEWDDSRICCAAVSHRAANNPLRAHGRLAAACGIEYAAQAMAVHGALRAASPDSGRAPAPRMGMLTSVRGVELLVARLDDIESDLIVNARHVAGGDDALVYEFTLLTGSRALATGRAAVLLDGGLSRESA